MSCYHPLYMIDRGLKDNGKRNLVFASTVKTNLGLSTDELMRRYGDRLVPVPCGHCIGCALDHSKEWAVRCVLESLEYEHNCFITLTFDEAHVPERLHKRDMQLFFKRLRKAFSGIEVRYFACGEYGSKSGRPHYHAILFGIDFADKKFLCRDGVSDLYTSDLLSKLWPFGISTVGELSFESCAYVARYTSKKAREAHGDEFLMMSTRPGLGRKWFESHQDIIYLSDKIYGRFGVSHIASVPRYFDKLAANNGVQLDLVKEKRIKCANNSRELLRYLYHKSEAEELSQHLERLLAEKILTLRRSY